LSVATLTPDRQQCRILLPAPTHYIHNKPDNNANNCDNKYNMDVAAKSIRRNQAKHPQYKKNNTDSH